MEFKNYIDRKNGLNLIKDGFILKNGRPSWVKIGFRLDDGTEFIDDIVKEAPVGTGVYAGHYPDDYIPVGIVVEGGVVIYEALDQQLVSQLEELRHMVHNVPESEKEKLLDKLRGVKKELKALIKNS